MPPLLRLMPTATRRVHAPRLAHAALAVSLCVPFVAQAQPAAFPSKPIRIIVPVAPGGGIDLVARAIAPRLGEDLGQPVVIENRGGNAMVTGTAAVARAAPDGHTLGLNNTNLAASPALRRSLPYETLRDIAPVSLLATQPSIAVVHPSLPVRNMVELVRLARARPNELTYGSGGIGTSIHLAAALISVSAGIEMLHVPYKGAGPVLADLVGGHLQVAVPTLGSALPFVNNSRLRALGVTTAKRLPALPQIPTVAESGLPGYEFTTWYGLTAPGGTPAPVVAALHAAVVRTIADPAVAAGQLRAAADRQRGHPPDTLWLRLDGTPVKIATWNVNSLNVRLPHVLDWLATHQPDALCLQETKLEDAKFPAAAIEAAGYRVAFSGQKTYNGVAILSRSEPLDVVMGIPGFDDPQKRVISATVDGVRLVCAYMPNGESVESAKYPYKLDWLARLTDWLRAELATHPALALLGDYNIAPDDRDVHDPAAWAGKVLCSEPERAAFRGLVGLGLVDSFRMFEQPERSWSWWDYRMNMFRRKLGLRIDHVLLSPALVARCTGCTIDIAPRAAERPSDHAPVVCELA